MANFLNMGYSGKSICILEKWLFSRKSGCITCKVVVFGTKCLYSGKSGCNRDEWFYLGEMVVFGQKWLYSGKI